MKSFCEVGSARTFSARRKQDGQCVVYSAVMPAVLPSTNVGHDSSREVRPFRKIWCRNSTVSEFRKIELTSSCEHGGRLELAAILNGRRKHATSTWETKKKQRLVPTTKPLSKPISAKPPAAPGTPPPLPPCWTPGGSACAYSPRAVTGCTPRRSVSSGADRATPGRSSAPSWSCAARSSRTRTRTAPAGRPDRRGWASRRACWSCPGPPEWPSSWSGFPCAARRSGVGRCGQGIQRNMLHSFLLKKHQKTTTLLLIIQEKNRTMAEIDVKSLCMWIKQFSYLK